MGHAILGRRILGTFAISAVLLAGTATSNQAEAASNCTCVTFLSESERSIPKGIGSAANAGPVLERNGYKKVGPQANAIMVWARGKKGADSGDGHIARVLSAGYDSKKKVYVITVIHANWSEGSKAYGPFRAPCQNGNVRVTTFNRWTDLDGLTFYKK